MLFQEAFKSISKYLKFNWYSDRNTCVNNISGDSVSKSDMICNDFMVNDIKNYDLNIIGYISEESENIIFIKEPSTTEPNYIAAFDPLDGSSNVKYNINSGTIYCIYEFDYENYKFKNIFKAGYCLYGSSLVLVETQNTDLKMYVLDVIQWHIMF